jgi:4'-phosphopantetheinyl transferase EntD
MLAPTLDSCTIAHAEYDPAALGESSLGHDARCRDWLAGRLAAKRAVAEHCAVDSGRLCIAGRPHAAPVALLQSDAKNWVTLPLAISISHHDGHGLAAVTDRAIRLGVDIARIGEIEPEHERYFLAPSERSVAERIGATALWAFKEAAWKALSLSPETPFSTLAVAIDANDELCGLRLRDRRLRASGYTWQVGDTLIAAVVCVGGDNE